MGIGVALSLAILGAQAGAASAATFPAISGLGAIPDGPNADCSGPYPDIRDVRFDVSGVSSPITNVSVSFTLDPKHTWVSDLTVDLYPPTFPNGGVQIFGRTGVPFGQVEGDDSDAAGPYTFSDSAPASPSWWEAAASVPGSGTIPSGTYRASHYGAWPDGGQSLPMAPAFAATDPNGQWILYFVDYCQGNTGSVAAASLTLNEPIASPLPGPSTSLPGPGPTISPTSTGLRAAALRKCKKKKSAQKRKKCRKRARQLPV